MQCCILETIKTLFFPLCCSLSGRTAPLPVAPSGCLATARIQEVKAQYQIVFFFHTFWINFSQKKLRQYYMWVSSRKLVRALSSVSLLTQLLSAQYFYLYLYSWGSIFFWSTWVKCLNSSSLLSRWRGANLSPVSSCWWSPSTAPCNTIKTINTQKYCNTCPRTLRTCTHISIMFLMCSAYISIFSNIPSEPFCIVVPQCCSTR